MVDEPFVEFSVADTGIGMAAESLPHIFDKFRQVDSTTTRHYSGAGLGLYLVKSFAAVMGGSVSVQSTLGEGTTFTVRIPIGTASSFLEDTAVSPNITTTGVVPSAYLEGEL
jgi:signal transduction histidine kinase